MEDDVLVQKVFNYICGSGGFVQLPVLLRRNAPLGSRKSKQEARNWLRTRAEFVLVKDHNGEDMGVRIDFRKKICQQYAVKGSCRWARGTCKYWHICKSFIEGKCNGTCRLSHNFHNEDNVDKVKELRLQKYSNGALKNIVTWSLPHVCELYQRSECKSDKCPYIHVCCQAVCGSPCHCALSHNLTDCHNMKVLKEYDLVPPRQVLNFDFVRCSILMLDEEHSVGPRNTSSEGRTTVTRQPAVALDKCPERSRFSNGEAASVFFERLCKEFSCSETLAKLQNKKVVFLNELEDFFSLLELHKDKFLVSRNARGTIQEVTAFCPNLRLCLDFVSLNECKNKQCLHFHLCRKFITGNCRRGENCPRSHSFRNKRDKETLSHLSLEGLTDEQLRQLMLSSSPLVCIDYNNGNCNSGSLCSRVHICKRFVRSACRNGDSCNLDHKQALDTLHTSSLIKKYKLDDSHHNSVLKAILVSEEHDDGYDCSHGKSDSATRSGLPAKDDNFVEKWVIESEPTQTLSSQTSKAQQNRRRSSMSSSCSSVAAEDKVNPSKDTVFASICKEYDGSVPFAIISKRRDLFPGNSKDIANWFRERKETFLLTEDADGSILEVSSFCPKARLCFNYLSSSGCSRDNCQYFHICREYIAGCCKFFHRCKWNHDFQFDSDRKFISKLKLDGLTQEELCKVVQLSMPQVCMDYNAGACRRGSFCAQIHVCKDFVKRRCHDEEDCGLQHENALLTPRAAVILEKYGMKCTAANTTSMLKELLVCENSFCPRTESQDSVISKQTNLKLKTETLPGGDSVNAVTSHISPVADSSDSCNFSLPLTDESNVISKQMRSATTWTPCWPTERQVFECLCTEYDCSASFTTIAKRKDLFPHGVDSAESWFRRAKGSFLITESEKEKGKILQVEAFSARARLCLNYTSNGKCQKVDCTNFHVCKDYISDACVRGEQCTLNHHFHNKRDKALLSTFMIDPLTEQQLRKLVLMSTPQLCVEYNNGICSRGHSCRRIHLCCGCLRKCCKEQYKCGLDHEEALKTSHSRAVFVRLQVSYTDSHDTMKMILDDKLCLSSKDKINCHIHADNPDAHICSRFLSGECQKGVKCLEHHCFLPYHWQYKVLNFDEWKSFGEKDNLTLEKLYCNVSLDTQVKFQPAQALDVSFPKSEDGFLTTGQGYGIKVDLDKMVMCLTQQSSRVAFRSQLRRLSTIALVAQPCEIMQTNWKWYWKDNGNVWLKYGKDRSERDLQLLIEQTFLEGRNRQMKFTTSAHEYNLFFNSNGMYQVNLQTGTKRPVRRRPAELICHEDMDDLKWRHGDSSVREQISRKCTKYKYIPTHWSPMPPNTQYERVLLMSYEEEYQRVEQLFRRTMNDQVIINRIERVQNPFLLEKYCRKKENMIAVAKRTLQAVNEKQLFHGTSPNAVEAICKQNFDWRLHGKNATVYGEGSYFAVNASYSHTYAKKDVNSFQFMFLAKVLVGSYTTGHSSYRRPPAKKPSDPASDLYDSCVNNQANPTIFVVFDTDQFYPEYIIQYSAVTSAYVLPQASTAQRPRTASSRPNPPLSPPQKGILKHTTSSSTAVTSAYYTLQQASTSPSQPKPPISQPLKGILKHPTSYPSSTVTTSNPNGSATRSSYYSTATGRNLYLPTTSTYIASATNSSVSVSQSSHSSKAANTTASNASSSSVRSGYPPVTSSNQRGSAVRSVTQASAPINRSATPWDYYSSSSPRGSPAATTASSLQSPKKKKDCLIM